MRNSVPTLHRINAVFLNKPTAADLCAQRRWSNDCVHPASQAVYNTPCSARVLTSASGHYRDGPEPFDLELNKSQDGTCLDARCCWDLSTYSLATKCDACVSDLPDSCTLSHDQPMSGLHS